MRSNLPRLTVALALVSTATSTARAQDNAATVEALFADGKRLMADGKVGDACPKFLASYNLEHRVGTLLNLASCYEQNGQVATAWARFVEARALAARSGQPERADFAAQHAAALELRRSMLTIVVPQPAPGLVLRRDGVVVDPAAYGSAVPVDGGAHTIDATAPDMKPLTASMTMGAEGDKKTYTLPALTPQPQARLDARRDTTPETALAPVSEAGRGSSTNAYLGLGIAGAGVVAAGVGAFFGAQAVSKNGDSNSNGNCTGNLCNPTGFAARNDARSDGNISTVLIGVGAAAVVGGIVLWRVSVPGATSGANAAQVRVGLAPAGISLRGDF